jgi:hypothetical protein
MSNTSASYLRDQYCRETYRFAAGLTTTAGLAGGSELAALRSVEFTSASLLPGPEIAHDCILTHTCASTAGDLPLETFSFLFKIA